MNDLIARLEAQIRQRATEPFDKTCVEPDISISIARLDRVELLHLLDEARAEIVRLKAPPGASALEWAVKIEDMWVSPKARSAGLRRDIAMAIEQAEARGAATASASPGALTLEWANKIVEMWLHGSEWAEIAAHNAAIEAAAQIVEKKHAEWVQKPVTNTDRFILLNQLGYLISEIRALGKPEHDATEADTNTAPSAIVNQFADEVQEAITRLARRY